MSESKIRLLVVDDERPIRRFLSASLGGQFAILEASTGQDAIASIVSTRPDIILLDLGLPDMDGINVLRRMREWSQIPVIVISVREREEEKIEALDAGADDYLTKPFGTGELTARIRVALRRSFQPELEPVFQRDDLQVDFSHRSVVAHGQPINLTPTEYDILRVLVQHAGKVLTHDLLIRAIWGSEAASVEEDSHLLRVNVSNLRRKIEKDPSRPHFIVTEPGVGYRLKTTEIYNSK